MKRYARVIPIAAAALFLTFVIVQRPLAQSGYRAIANWGQLPDGMKWGEVPNASVDP